MAYTGIDKQESFFNTKLYTGTGSSNAITGVGFQPDLVWIKNRATTGNHAWFNAISGVTKYINSNTNYSEQTSAPTLTAFGTDGFTVGSSSDLNGNGNNIVSWNWKANGAGSANTAGSINSTVSVNTSSGFSIVKYTGTGANATVGHGLGVAPSMILFKNLDTARNWIVYHKDIGATKNLYLDLNNSQNTESATFQDTAPTNTVFSIGTSVGVNESGDNIVAYCFADKTGFSKFGSYKGNGSSDGVFVYTGFKPAFLMLKRANSNENWHMFDIKRDPRYPTNSSYGGMATRLMANLNNSSDLSQGGFRFLSNGLKMTTSWSGGNGSGDTFIYMCFGQSLVGSNDIPCTAR